MDNLPIPQAHGAPNIEDDKLVMPNQRRQSITDILDWLSSVFGFQVKLVLNVLLSFESIIVP